MISVLRSTRSIGFTLFSTSVFITLSSKQCVAAMITCRDACSTGRAPDRVSASSRSNAASFSDFCSSAPRVLVVALASKPACALLVQLLPGLIMVGRRELSGSYFVYISSKQSGYLVKSIPLNVASEGTSESPVSICTSVCPPCCLVVVVEVVVVLEEVGAVGGADEANALEPAVRVRGKGTSRAGGADSAEVRDLAQRRPPAGGADCMDIAQDCTIGAG
mmetsp:Transcript_13176/g.26698  ORF Transcript_13176/g.26698 Transcript_13176/m.26698 type:complete len:220 (+) Transcript_13176:356-1015(+)